MPTSVSDDHDPVGWPTIILELCVMALVIAVLYFVFTG